MSKRPKKRAHPIVYLQATGAIAIASWVGFSFTRIIELALTHSNDLYYVAGLVVAAVVLLLFFTVVFWLIDRHGWIAQFLSSGKES